MKTIIQRFVGVTVLSFALVSVAKAQSASTTQLPSSAQQISWNQVPSSGTFWVMGPNEFAPPYPSPPLFLSGVAPIYALDNGQFVVDAQNVKNLDQLAAAAATRSQQFSPLDKPQPDPPLITSNAWFNEIVISNHTYVSLSNATFSGLNDNLMTYEFPSGVMFAVTATNLTAPQWQPVGQTNAIGNSAFELPYNPGSTPIAFYRICAQLDTNIPSTNVVPFSLIATNIAIQTDYGVTLTWTNSQPGFAPESDTIVQMDTNGHSYLVDSVITTGAVGSLSFELQSTNNLTFVLYATNANLTADQFFLPTNNFVNPDVVTVPYLINTNSGRTIIEVEAYDVTDPSNPQFLAKIAKTGIGPEPTYKGTLEIPGVSLYPGVDTLEFRATDSGFGQTATDVTITNYQLVSIVSPILSLESDGTNRIATAGGGYGVGFEAVTTATNGTWVVNTYDPSGNLVGTVSADVTNIGQSIIYDDGSTPSTVFPVPYYDVQVTVNPPGGQPSGQSDPLIRVYLLPPRSNAGSIVAYDGTILQGLSSSDQQTVLGDLVNGLSQTFEFIYQINSIANGIWSTVSNPTATDLNTPPGVGWGWEALQAGLSGSDYSITVPPTYAWTNQTPDRPILGLAILAHGGIDNNGVAQGFQGPFEQGGSDTVTEQSLEVNYHFDKDTNAVAIAVFVGCRVGAGPFMQFILRNRGHSGQIPSNQATIEKIRPCFGIGWTQDIPISNITSPFNWLSYWSLFATELGGTGSSPFLYTLDQAYNQAQQYDPSDGVGTIWSGTTGNTLDQFAQ